MAELANILKDKRRENGYLNLDIPESKIILDENGYAIDVKKYEKIYEEIKCLEPEDTLQLTLEADSEEQREFYQMVGDFLLQKKQKQVIARNLF